LAGGGRGGHGEAASQEQVELLPEMPKVDWSKSAAFRDRTGERTLNAEETAELYESF